MSQSFAHLGVSVDCGFNLNFLGLILKISTIHTQIEIPFPSQRLTLLIHSKKIVKLFSGSKEGSPQKVDSSEQIPFSRKDNIRGVANIYNRR